MEGAEVDVANSVGNSEVDALVASTICAHTTFASKAWRTTSIVATPPAKDNRFRTNAAQSY